MQDALLNGPSTRQEVGDDETGVRGAQELRGSRCSRATDASSGAQSGAAADAPPGRGRVHRAQPATRRGDEGHDHRGEPNLAWACSSPNLDRLRALAGFVRASHASRSNRRPAFHTATSLRVALMSAVGLPSVRLVERKPVICCPYIEGRFRMVAIKPVGALVRGPTDVRAVGIYCRSTH